MTFRLGDVVQINTNFRNGPISGDRVGGYAHRTVTLRPDDTATVTRAGNMMALVRVEGQGSIWVENAYLQLAGLTAAGRRRGTPPEGGISPDDPNLQWLWDDISEYAEKSDYCNVFDKILRDLGLPPRKRKFAAVGDLNGLSVTAQIMAANQREANEELARRISAALAEVVSA